jgi:hypothetical protein
MTPPEPGPDQRRNLLCMSEPVHLSNHHRKTLQQVFEHPVSHNIEWRAVLSLLESVGSVANSRGGKVAVTIGSRTEDFKTAGRKDLDADEIVKLREMLATAGYTPAAPEA